MISNFGFRNAKKNLGRDLVRSQDARRGGRCGRVHGRLLSKGRGRDARKAGQGECLVRCRAEFSRIQWIE